MRFGVIALKYSSHSIFQISKVFKDLEFCEVSGTIQLIIFLSRKEAIRYISECRGGNKLVYPKITGAISKSSNFELQPDPAMFLEIFISEFLKKSDF